MRNTIIVSILLFIAVVVASVYYFGGLDKEEQESVKPIAYFPSDTYLISSFVNDETTDNIFKDFEVFEAIMGKSSQTQFSTLKQQLLRNKDLSTYLLGADIFFSVHPGKNGLETLISIPSKEEINPEKFIQLLPQLSKQYKNRILDTLGKKLIGFNYIHTDSTGSKVSDSTFYVSYHNHIFFSSYSKDLILKVLDPKQEKLKENQIDYFNKKLNRNAPFNVFVPQQNIKNFVSEIKENKAGDFLRQFINLGGQSVWSINYKQDAMMLSGESELVDSKKEYLSIFANQRKKNQNLSGYFPSSTAMYIEYSVSDTARFHSDLKSWQQLQEGYKQLENQIASIEKEKSGRLSEFQNALGGNFAVLEQSNSDYLGYISISDSSKFDSIVNQIADQVSDSLYRFKHSNIPYILYGESLKAFSRPYFLKMDGLIVMANHQSTVEEFAKKWRRKDLLTGSLGFKNYEELQGNEANVTFFINSKNSSSFLSNVLKDKYSKIFQNKDEYGFQDFYSWSLQLSGNNGNFLSRLYAIYKSKNRLGVNAEWTYEMNSRLINGPYVFEQSDSSQFIFVQEQDHTVHAIHPQGKKLWSSIFSGRIVGKVVQLEDRSLILVTDRRRLYRFDSYGKMMRGFSTSVSGEPSAEPTIAELEGQKIIFIPAGNKILAYDMEGGPVDIWSNIQFDGEIQGALQFVDNELIFATSYGRVYFYNSSGEKTKEIDIPGDVNFVSAVGISKEASGTKYFATGSDGNLYEMHADGSSRILFEGKWSKKHFADFVNLMGTTAPELSILDGSYLQVFELADSVKQLYDYNFTQSISNRPYLIGKGNGLYSLGVAAQGTNLIYLFNETGAITDGFPVEAQPLFYYGKINYNSGNFLICTRRDFKIYAFRH